MMTDPISDMLTRLRNALAVKKQEVVLPYSKMKFALAKVLEKEGYLVAVEKVTKAKFPMLRVEFKYENNVAAMQRLKRVSKPGRRVYSKSTELPNVESGFGMAIISTPNGLMTNREARSRRLGGEVICEIV